MTRSQVVAFLEEAGVVHSAPAEGDGNAIDFRNRGTAMRVVTYERGDLLHLTCSSRMPIPEPAAARVMTVFQSIEDEFPVVKMSSFVEGDDAGFMVSAEQFEAEQPHLRDVFWKTADLVVAAAEECRRRFEAPAPMLRARDVDEHGRWVAQLEAALAAGCPPAELAGSRTPVFARVKRALALVLTEDGSTGSAFCVASDRDASYFVTNAHVVEDAAALPLYRQVPGFEKHDARVVARERADGVDLAVMRVEAAGLPALRFDTRHPKSEGAVALAGYARVHIWAAEQFGELVPSLRRGSITGVLRGGACVLHDVLCRPGDSGAPLFAPATGTVVGVQTGGWTDEEEGYAIGASVVTAFLERSGVHSNATRSA